ncbi:MAG: reductive dehalogenase [Anaerolineae bacterium]|nr:reductive dehalogenase [Anaerolineae bacterium]
MTQWMRLLRKLTPLSGPVKKPTYCKNIVGDITPWDERDIVFARHDLHRFFGADSTQYKAYYAKHPELEERDIKIAAMPGLGRGGGIDEAMFAAQFAALDMISPDAFVDGDPAPEKVTIPVERAALKVKELARVLGADLIGIGPLKQEWVYTHVARSMGDKAGFDPYGTPVDLSHHTNAIAMGFAMNYDLIQHAPDFPVLLATAEGYATGAWVAVQLAQYIRMLGYSARAHHFHNYQVLVVPVAVDCGIGELSRAGYLLSKEYGLGLRLAIVTTDMPLQHDAPVDLGVQSFCETCKVCAETCPSQAIPFGDKVEVNGTKRWKLDEEACYRYWFASGTDCGICMASCPWTKRSNWLHNLVVEVAGIKGPHQRLLPPLDKLIYGEFEAKQRPDYIDPLVKQRRKNDDEAHDKEQQ